MSDSSEIVFPNPIQLDPSLKSSINITGCYSEWKKVSALIEQGQLVNVKALGSYAFGVTSAKNNITADLDSSGANPFKVNAYVLSANYPASTVDNNALPENLVYLTAVCAKLITQKHLLKNNVHAAIVKLISLKLASFNSLTLTFLFKFPTSAAATEALSCFTGHAKMLHCHGQGVSLKADGRKALKGKKNNVKQYGDSSEFTTYINVDSDFHVTAYVKPGKRGASHAKFGSQEDADSVYAISETCVRVEVKLGRKWLESHGLQQPDSWKNSLGTAAYKLVLEELRGRLRVDECLRRNEPQDRHLEGLSPLALIVAKAHLNGENVWQLPSMTPNRCASAVAVHREILTKLHIDLEFPWDQQRGKADHKLGEWLNWSNQYQVPKKIAHLCMVRSTLVAKLNFLQAEVDTLMATAAAQQASSAAASAAKKGSVKPVKKNKLLPLVKRQWRERQRDEQSNETSDISDLVC
jgi:hypothetical protein